MPDPLKDAVTMRFANRPISGWAAKTSRTSSCLSIVSGTIVCRDRSVAGWFMRSLKHAEPSRGRGLRSDAESASEFGSGCRVPPARREDRRLHRSEERFASCDVCGGGWPEFHLPLSPLALHSLAQIGGAHMIVDELGDDAGGTEEQVSGAVVLNASQRRERFCRPPCERGRHRS